MISAILSGCLLLVTAVPAAQTETWQLQSASPAHPVEPPLIHPTKDPFARLFPIPQTRPQPAEPSVPSKGTIERNGSHAEIICGMRIWRVDERQDPRILLPRQPTTVDAKIRKIAPTTCHNPVPEDPSKR